MTTFLDYRTMGNSEQDMLLKREEMQLKMEEMQLKMEEMQLKKEEMQLKKEEMEEMQTVIHILSREITLLNTSTTPSTTTTKQLLLVIETQADEISKLKEDMTNELEEVRAPSYNRCECVVWNRRKDIDRGRCKTKGVEEYNGRSICRTHLNSIEKDKGIWNSNGGDYHLQVGRWRDGYYDCFQEANGKSFQKYKKVHDHERKY